MMFLDNFPEIGRLSAEDKIRLGEDLWESIVSAEKTVPVLASHRRELESRRQDYQNHPDDLLTLEELQARIENKMGLPTKIRTSGKTP